MPEETTVKISQIEPDGSGDAISDTELSPVAMSKKEPHIFRLLFKPKEWSATFTGSPQIVDLNRNMCFHLHPISLYNSGNNKNRAYYPAVLSKYQLFVFLLVVS